MPRNRDSKYITENNPFATALRALMDGRTPRVTQEELAKLLGVSKTSIGYYRQGQTEPSFDALCKIADFFGVSTDFLLGRAADGEAAVPQKTSGADDPARTGAFGTDSGLRECLGDFLELDAAVPFLDSAHHIYNVTTVLYTMTRSGYGVIDYEEAQEAMERIRGLLTELRAALYAHSRSDRAVLAEWSHCYDVEDEAERMITKLAGIKKPDIDPDPEIV